jgi:hypothetical protein
LTRWSMTVGRAPARVRPSAGQGEGSGSSLTVPFDDGVEIWAAQWSSLDGSGGSVVGGGGWKYRGKGRGGG